MAAPNPTGREIVQLGVQARYTGDRASAPNTNAALQLADSLRDLNPGLQTFLTRYGQQLAERQRQKARADVLLSSGQRFADAVRDGRIEPTQNPFYIQAYHQEAGQVRGRRALADLLTQSSSWEQRNDPRAFQDRWNTEVGAIAQEYADNPDEMAGFRIEEAQASQQAVAANTAQNVDRIQRERVSNLSAIIATRVARVNAQNGGNASPQQIFEDLADLHEQVLGTGGTEEEWDRLVASGLTTAAYNQADADLLDALKYERPGQTITVYNRPGVADGIESDRYRIQQAAASASRARVDQRQAEVAAEGDAAVDVLFTEFGEDINNGTLDPQRMTAALRSQNVSERAISYALNSVQRSIADSEALSNAYIGHNPSVTRMLVDARNGRLTQDQVTEAVVGGEIDNSTASQLLNAITASGGTADPVNLRNARELTQALVNIDAMIAQQLSSAGNRVSDQQRRRHRQAIQDAARAHLAANPGDFNGALQAGRDAGAAAVQTYLQRRAGQSGVSSATQGHTQQTPAPRTGDNPRR